MRYTDPMDFRNQPEPVRKSAEGYGAEFNPQLASLGLTPGVLRVLKETHSHGARDAEYHERMANDHSDKAIAAGKYADRMQKKLDSSMLGAPEARGYEQELHAAKLAESDHHHAAFAHGEAAAAMKAGSDKAQSSSLYAQRTTEMANQAHAKFKVKKSDSETVQKETHSHGVRDAESGAGKKAESAETYGDHVAAEKYHWEQAKKAPAGSELKEAHEAAANSHGEAASMHRMATRTEDPKVYSYRAQSASEFANSLKK